MAASRPLLPLPLIVGAKYFSALIASAPNYRCKVQILYDVILDSFTLYSLRFIFYMVFHVCIYYNIYILSG